MSYWTYLEFRDKLTNRYDMGYYFQNKSFGNFKLNKINKKIHPHAISGIQTQFNNLKNEKEKKNKKLNPT